MSEDDLFSNLNSLPAPPSRTNKAPTEQSLQHKYDKIRGSDSSLITGIKPKSASHSSAISPLDTMHRSNPNPYGSTMKEDWNDIVDDLHALSGGNNNHGPSKNASPPHSSAISQNTGFYAMTSADELMNEFNSLIQDERELDQARNPNNNNIPTPTEPPPYSSSPNFQHTSFDPPPYSPQQQQQQQQQQHPQNQLSASPSTHHDINIDDLTEEVIRITGYTPHEMNELEKAVESGDFAKLAKIKPPSNTKSPTASTIGSKITTTVKRSQKSKKSSQDHQHIDFLADSVTEDSDGQLDSGEEELPDKFDQNDAQRGPGSGIVSASSTPSTFRSNLHSMKYSRHDYQGDDEVMNIINQVQEENQLEEEVAAMQSRFNDEKERQLNEAWAKNQADDRNRDEKLKQEQQAQEFKSAQLQQQQQQQQQQQREQSLQQTKERPINQHPQPGSYPSGVEYYQQIQANKDRFILPTTAPINLDDEFDDLFQ